MKLQQLRYLVAIAENGLNITAAAEKLFTSQPGVSRQLKLLEEELGVQIFSRRGKSLEAVTAAGEEVIQRAVRVLREVENIRAVASNHQAEQRGSLDIGTTHTQARYVLPPVIKSFRERFPEVSLNLHQGTSEQIADMVAAGQIDFAIATGGQDLFSDLKLLPCYRWDRVVIVPRDHALTRLGRPLTLEDLGQFPLVTYVFSFSGESSLKKAFAGVGVEPEVVFTARDADVIKTYVRIGMGVGIVAGMARECGADDDLAVVDATDLFPRSTTWIGFRRDAVLRDYMFDFMERFAPHIDRELATAAAACENQAQVDRLFADIELPVRGSCSEPVI